MPQPDTLLKRPLLDSPDSLLSGVDSLHIAPSTVDSLMERATDTLPAFASLEGWMEEQMNPLWRQIDTLPAEPFNPFLSVEEAYGPFSELVSDLQPLLPFRELLTNHPIFQGIVLLLSIAYSLLICAHLNEVVALIRRPGEERPMASRAIYTAVTIGLLLLSTLVVRLVEGNGFLYDDTVTLLISSLGASLAVILFQLITLYLIGQITITRELIRNLMHTKVLLFALGTILSTPVALLTLFTPPEEGVGWLLLLAGMGILVFLLFIKESFQLFLAKKISILHWFLYLCTVEFFPISLVILLAIRW